MPKIVPRTLALIALVASAGAFYWFKTPPPKVGGGQGDDFLAPWVKARIYSSVSLQEAAGFTRLTAENANGWYHVSREPIQSFDYYRSLNPMRPTPKRRVIVLQPLGPFNENERQLLIELQQFCAAFFQLPVRLEKPIPLPRLGVKKRPISGRFSSGAGIQFNADDMLVKVLGPHLPPDAVAYLGITISDLWASNLTFVFGLGSAENRVGIYSLRRYFPASENRTPQQQLQGLRRSCLVLDHEMGHMLGLYHCVLYKCAMNGSNSLADADDGPLDYCPVCLKKLLWNVHAAKYHRDNALLAFYRRYGLQRELNLTIQRIRIAKSGQISIL